MDDGETTKHRIFPNRNKKINYTQLHSENGLLLFGVICSECMRCVGSRELIPINEIDHSCSRSFEIDQRKKTKNKKQIQIEKKKKSELHTQQIST